MELQLIQNGVHAGQGCALVDTELQVVTQCVGTVPVNQVAERLQLEWISAAEGIRFAEVMHKMEELRKRVSPEEIRFQVVGPEETEPGPDGTLLPKMDVIKDLIRVTFED